jgi:hypothetical protein
MDLLIIAKDRPMLYDAFRRMSAGDTDIEIVVDRRNGAARRPASAVDRRGFDISQALKTTGWAVVPSRTRRDARTDAA